jgi:uncharacterized repeat protein (TIGR01451 family)
MLARMRRNESSAFSDETRYYGIVSAASDFMRGCTPDAPAYVGSGPVGATTPMTPFSGWDGDGNFGDAYGGHEIGHELGRHHPNFLEDSGGFCISGKQDDSTVDSAYPYKNGFIDEITATNPIGLAYFGFDVGDSRNSLPVQLYSPSQWTDMMTYCNFNWISDHTYRGILSKLQSTNVLVSDAGASTDHVLILGTLNLTRDTFAIDTISREPGLKLTPRPASSAYQIEFRGSSNQLLAAYPFAPHPYGDNEPGQDQLALVDEVVPYVAGTALVAVTHSGLQLAARAVSAGAPVVTILFPNGGELLNGNQVQVSWTGSDPNGDSLTYSLLYSFDGGQTWRSIATGLTAVSHLVAVDKLPGGSQALFRVIANDGFNTGAGDSDRVFSVPLKAPRVHITTPANNAAFSAGQTLVLAGEAQDLQDGALDGNSLRWLVDQQTIGFGRLVSASGLTAGNHSITLEARNQGGAVSTAAVAVIVSSTGANDVIPGNNSAGPDLAIAKSDSGDFEPGQLRAAYTIRVSNLSTAPTSGVVQVTDALPAGLRAVSISGSGWTCISASLTCTRADSLAPNTSYAPIELVVDVDANAQALVVNTARVSGGGDLNTPNNTATDPTNIRGIPDMQVIASHQGDFAVGQPGAYSIRVINWGTAITTAPVEVVDILPAGLTATAIGGDGWNCSLTSLRCTRADPLNSNTAYPPVVLTVMVASTASAVVVNSASVSGGGELNTGNNSFSDPTNIMGGRK